LAAAPAATTPIARARRKDRKRRGRWDIISLSPEGIAAMEAERLNQLAASLTDLAARTADLRRYL
jgi:hypothetical protein